MVVFTVNEQLLKKNNLNYDGLLTLFAVSDKSQGMGIGKDLLNQVKTYWKKTNTNHIYLFTDDKCIYGFYDYNNFKRIDNEFVSIDDTILDFYIYSLKI